MKTKNSFLRLEDLTKHKSQLKQEMEGQKLQVTLKYKEILSPLTLIISIASTFHKGLNLVNGLQTGLKVVSFIKNIFSKK